jgi:hypothetical protein
VNDHGFKVHLPGWWSGKLSDVAILVVGPLFLQGLWEHSNNLLGRPWGPSSRVLAAAVAVTVVAFCLEKTVPWATALYRVLWGTLRWPWDALVGVLWGVGVPRWAPVAAVRDPSDLWTLPSVALCAVVHRDRCGPWPGAGTMARVPRGRGSDKPRAEG